MVAYCHAQPILGFTRCVPIGARIPLQLKKVKSTIRRTRSLEVIAHVALSANNLVVRLAALSENAVETTISECACVDKCTFLEDGRVFCVDHVESIHSESETPFLADPWQPDRMNSRLYIYPDACEWGDHVSLLRTMYLKEKVKYNTLTFRSGALAVIDFGLLSLDIAEKLQQRREGAANKLVHADPLGRGEKVPVSAEKGAAHIVDASVESPSACLEMCSAAVEPRDFEMG
eukprot:CAMPEP_0184693502 /NCGR_PEP_ID=MMETSP0313-20130426/1696_1 /TAXON_ID=2792 /ORGANISM="Porphyridium aerugineum, Strain SAG 1380-2" /LENGTH=231 /DNA_ID=CAMNT_0027151585 /DNA_START=70 /DNA_END=760 /DNA_ORIENTATION=-